MSQTQTEPAVFAVDPVKRQPAAKASAAKTEPWYYENSMAAHVAHDVLTFALWKYWYVATLLIANYARATVLALPIGTKGLAALAWGQTCVATHYVLLKYGRIALFEYLYSGKEYVSPRDPKELNKKSYMFMGKKMPCSPEIIIQTTLWSILLGFMYRDTHVDPFDLTFLSAENVLKATLLWCVTDLFFYVQHRSAHSKLLYWRMHSTHHTIRAPTAYKDCERFEIVDGTAHMVSYWLGAMLTGCVVTVTPDMWLLAAGQWFVCGQLAHGGKDVPVTLMWGLHAVMRLCGVRENLPTLHDHHHTRGTGNFCMMGIADKCAGTFVKI